MADTPHGATVLTYTSFRFRDPLTGTWRRARNVAERHSSRARYAENLNHLVKAEDALRIAMARQ